MGTKRGSISYLAEVSSICEFSTSMLRGARERTKAILVVWRQLRASPKGGILLLNGVYMCNGGHIVDEVEGCLADYGGKELG